MPTDTHKPYAKLWPIIEGAVEDAFKSHPDYLTHKGRRSAKGSVVKRVFGTITGFVDQSTQGRVGTPAATSDGAPFAHQTGERASNPSPPIFRVRIGKVRFKRGVSSRILTEFNVTTNRLIAEMKAKAK